MQATEPHGPIPVGPRSRARRGHSDFEREPGLALREVKLADDDVTSEGGVDLRTALSSLAEAGDDDGVSDDERCRGLPVPPRRASRRFSDGSVTVVHTFCAFEEFDSARLPALIGQHFPGVRPVRWSRGQETIYIPWAGRPPSSRRGARRPADQHKGGRSPRPHAGEEPRAPPGAGTGDKCVVFFIYGVVVMWGTFSSEEDEQIHRIADLSGLRALPKGLVETDEHVVYYSEALKVQIQDDIIRLPHCLCGHAATRLAIAHALAQSVKLCVFEEQGKQLVDETNHMPRELAQSGQISLSHGQLSRVIGRLYMHKNQVNLMSNVLETPEYFWQAQDWVQEVYKTLGRYLEVPERVGAVNARLEVTQDMLDMLQSRHETKQGERLEWIIIVLVAVEVVIGLFEFFGMIGVISVDKHTVSIPLRFTAIPYLLLAS